MSVQSDFQSVKEPKNGLMSILNAKPFLNYYIPSIKFGIGIPAKSHKVGPISIFAIISFIMVPGAMRGPIEVRCFYHKKCAPLGKHYTTSEKGNSDIYICQK